jgi:hypothetical protein
MRYPMPSYRCAFEIPDDWIAEAGFKGFRAERSAYRSSANSALIPLELIEPLFRSVSTPLDFHGFSRARFIRLLQGFVGDQAIPTVPAIHLPVQDFCAGTFHYRVCNGVHRLYEAPRVKRLFRDQTFLPSFLPSVQEAHASASLH